MNDCGFTTASFRSSKICDQSDLLRDFIQVCQPVNPNNWYCFQEETDKNNARKIFSFPKDNKALGIWYHFKKTFQIIINQKQNKTLQKICFTLDKLLMQSEYEGFQKV